MNIYPTPKNYVDTDSWIEWVKISSAYVVFVDEIWRCIVTHRADDKYSLFWWKLENKDISLIGANGIVSVLELWMISPESSCLLKIDSIKRSLLRELEEEINSDALPWDRVDISRLDIYPVMQVSDEYKWNIYQPFYFVCRVSNVEREKILINTKHKKNKNEKGMAVNVWELSSTDFVVEDILDRVTACISRLNLIEW